LNDLLKWIKYEIDKLKIKKLKEKKINMDLGLKRTMVCEEEKKKNRFN